MLFCYFLLNNLLNRFNGLNTFNNNILVIKELITNKLVYKNSISINYNSRIKSQKRIIQKINRLRIPYDIYGLRIIYEDSLDMNNSQFAYIIKDFICNNFYTIDYLYDDYIKYPKINKYQSLHVYIITNILIEIQIRNSLMNFNAINGTASNYY